jgi:hypothetical protein
LTGLDEFHPIPLNASLYNASMIHLIVIINPFTIIVVKILFF